MTDDRTVLQNTSSSDLFLEHALNILGEFALLLDEEDGFVDQKIFEEWRQDRALGCGFSMTQEMVYRCQRCKMSWPCRNFISCSPESFTPKTESELEEIKTTITLTMAGHTVEVERHQRF